jgi:hypothetical protein
MSEDIFTNSFSYLKQYPIVFVPDIAYIIINYVMIYLLYAYTGLGDIIPVIATGADPQLLTAFLQENLGKLILGVSIFAILTFTVGVGASILRFSIIKDILAKKRIVLKTIWKEKKEYFWKVVSIRILTFIILLVSLLMACAIILLVFLPSKALIPFVADSVGIVVAIIALVGIILYVKLNLLFIYPILFMSKTKRPVSVIRKSLSYFKKHSKYVFVTFVVILAVQVLIGLFAWVISLLIGLPSDFITSAAMIATLGAIGTAVSSLVSLAGKLWANIYLFSKYKNKLD